MYFNDPVRIPSHTQTSMKQIQTSASVLFFISVFQKMLEAAELSKIVQWGGEEGLQILTSNLRRITEEGERLDKKWVYYPVVEWRSRSLFLFPYAGF